jgi:signal peptidase I
MKKFREILTNKWFKFGVVAFCYLLWVIWLSNFWWLIGLGVIFDLYITKKVKWAFWKKHYKEGEKRNVWLDWLDAIIFALIAATFIRMYFYEAYVIPSSSMERTLMTGDYLFVSKSYYGPRVPETPLSVPLVHNSIPVLNIPSYLEWIKWDYRRMAGRHQVERDDIVVFGFPHGDTVLTKQPMYDYYSLARMNGKAYTIATFGPITVRPVDKKDNYVKRCVAIAGDTLEIQHGTVIVNGVAQKNIPGIQFSYSVKTNGMPINTLLLEKMGIDVHKTVFDNNLPGYPRILLTNENVEQLKQMSNVVEVEQWDDIYPPDYPDTLQSIFPFENNFEWTRDNLGPLWVPAKGATVQLTVENLPLYRRIIEVYEHNTLRVEGTVIYINDIETDSYTFKMDYYFMMGDNRHDSLDSRYWGFVPEDHIVGTPAMIWMSSDGNKSFPKNIRWSRLFNFL